MLKISGHIWKFVGIAGVEDFEDFEDFGDAEDFDDFEDFCNAVKNEISYQIPGEKEFNRMKNVLDSENRKNDDSRVSVFRSFDDKDRYIKKMEK